MEELYKKIYLKYRDFISDEVFIYNRKKSVESYIKFKNRNDFYLSYKLHEYGYNEKDLDENDIEKFKYEHGLLKDKNKIAVLKIKESVENNKFNELENIEIKNIKYIIGFLNPSQPMEKENIYNFNKFIIYNKDDKKELILSEITIINDIIIKKDKTDNINIIFDKKLFNEIDDIIIINIKDLIY